MCGESRMSTKPDEDIERAMIEISKLRACGLISTQGYETMWDSLEMRRSARKGALSRLASAAAKIKPENIGLQTPKKSAS